MTPRPCERAGTLLSFLCLKSTNTAAYVLSFAHLVGRHQVRLRVHQQPFQQNRVLYRHVKDSLPILPFAYANDDVNKERRRWVAKASDKR